MNFLQIFVTTIFESILTFSAPNFWFLQLKHILNNNSLNSIEKSNLNKILVFFNYSVCCFCCFFSVSHSFDFSFSAKDMIGVVRANFIAIHVIAGNVHCCSSSQKYLMIFVMNCFEITYFITKHFFQF